MDICKTILEVITHALKSEECRLRPRSERPGGPLWPWSVRGYPKEAWISYLLVREFSCRCPDQKLEMEANVGGVPQVDLSICGRASVELKGPYEVKEDFPPGLYRKILEDFEKQKLRAENDPDLEHFVLLILHAPKSEFDSLQNWPEQLKLKMTKKVPGTCIELHSSKPLDLNLGNEPPWRMMCCLYNVRNILV